MVEHEKDKKITILINNREYKAPKPSMTGREIKELGGGPMDYWLILVVPGGEDKQIQDEEVVDLKSGMHFRIVNPATFGYCIWDCLLN